MQAFFYALRFRAQKSTPPQKRQCASCGKVSVLSQGGPTGAGWFCPCPSQFVVIGADVLIMSVLHSEALGNGADLAKARVKMPGRLFAFIPQSRKTPAPGQPSGCRGQAFDVQSGLTFRPRAGAPAHGADGPRPWHGRFFRWLLPAIPPRACGHSRRGPCQCPRPTPRWWPPGAPGHSAR